VARTGNVYATQRGHVIVVALIIEGRGQGKGGNTLELVGAFDTEKKNP
jgi:hypothetical protein